MARRCVVEGCGRWVKAGRVVCREHAKTGAGREARGELRELMVALARLAEGAGGGEGAWVAREEFRRRVERGEFAALFAGRMERVLGAEERAMGFAAERGALRATLATLLSDEEIDVATLAREVSRVVDAAVRATRIDAATIKAERALVEGRLAALVEELVGAEEQP